MLKDKTGKNSSGSRYLPEVISEGIQPVFRILTKKAVFANDEEVSENPRSRSARLRAAVRTDALQRQLVQIRDFSVTAVTTSVTTVTEHNPTEDHLHTSHKLQARADRPQRRLQARRTRQDRHHVHSRDRGADDRDYSRG